MRFLILPILLIASLTYEAYALSSPQTPSTRSIITIHEDGIAPFDTTTSTPPGTDANNSNGVVRNFDLITYNVELALNDADDTNLTAHVTLNSTASWTAVPQVCKTTEHFPTLTPNSELQDTTGDGLNDTLICNVGDQQEGTKYYLQPVARAVGNNTETVEASVSSTSDNNTNTTTNTHGPVQTTITAGFGLSLSKTIVSLPEADEIDYTPQYVPVNALTTGSEEGKIVNWHIALNYNTGSEFVTGGTQSFTIEDTWVGTHSNDPSVEGDNANGDYDDLIKMKGDVTGDPTDNCQLLNSNGGTVTCTQSNPGEPITIQINNVPTNQFPLAKVQLNMFYPYDDIFDPNGFATSETYNIDNTATLTGWGGGSLPITSTTGSTETATLTDTNGYLVSATRPGPLSFYKTFDGFSWEKTGKRAGVPGEIIEADLWISDSRMYNTRVGVCDTIDTNSFEFAGNTKAGKKDARDHGNRRTIDKLRGITFQSWLSGYNPMLRSYQNGGDAYQTLRDARDSGVVIKYSDVDYITTGDDHWSATCEDDLTGDGNSDWVSDYNTLPGGSSDVVRVRMMWERDLDQLKAAHSLHNRWYVAFSFDLKIKETAPLESYLPNVASTYDERIDYHWESNWSKPNSGLRPRDNSVNTLHYWNVEDDETNPLYSFNAFNADRVWVLPASMGIDKSTLSPDGPARSGDEVTFEIDPRTNGSNAADVTMTFTDTLPAGLTYLSDNCNTVYTAAGESCTSSVAGQIITFTVPNYQIGDDLPAFTLTAEVNSGVSPGTLTNQVNITSDFSGLTDDSHCDGAVNYLGNTDTTIEDRCRNNFAATHNAYASVLILGESGMRAEKILPDSDLVEVGANYDTILRYENLGTDMAQGQIIDILPHNGDGEESTQRYQETSTSDPDNNTEFISITGTNGETFEYSTTSYENINHKPCHPSNWPLGDTTATNTDLNTICSEGLLTTGDTYSLTETGTGTTTWDTALPTDLSTITAIRASFANFDAGDSDRDLTLTLGTKQAKVGDLLCNNFATNGSIITLDIISNDVCVTVIASSIGDTIYWDRNNDGTQGSDEPGLPNITVTLTHPDGSTTQTTTDANGNYLFDNLPAGEYTIHIDTDSLPTQMTNTADPDANNDSTSTYILGQEEDNVTQDFGYYTPPASLGNYIWIDMNKDGIKDSEEEGLPNITVTLTDREGNQQTTVTDAQGKYLFENLLPGEYTVTFQQPANYEVTYDYDGNKDTTSTYTLGAGENTLTQNFGLVPEEEPTTPEPPNCTMGSIGNHIFLDVNADGKEQKEKEPGIPDITVKLTYVGPDNIWDTDDDITHKETTGNKNNSYQGKYQFDNLPPGRYRIELDKDDIKDYIQTYDPTGATINRRASLTLGCNEEAHFLDFGFTQENEEVLAQTGPLL